MQDRCIRRFWNKRLFKTKDFITFGSLWLAFDNFTSDVLASAYSSQLIYLFTAQHHSASPSSASCRHPARSQQFPPHPSEQAPYPPQAEGAAAPQTPQRPSPSAEPRQSARHPARRPPRPPRQYARGATPAGMTAPCRSPTRQRLPYWASAGLSPPSRATPAAAASAAFVVAAAGATPRRRLPALRVRAARPRLGICRAPPACSPPPRGLLLPRLSSFSLALAPLG